MEKITTARIVKIKGSEWVDQDDLPCNRGTTGNQDGPGQSRCPFPKEYFSNHAHPWQ